MQAGRTEENGVESAREKIMNDEERRRRRRTI